MLSSNDYHKLWNLFFNQHVNCEIPAYQEYVGRYEFYNTYLIGLGDSKVRYILIGEAPPFHDKTKSSSGAYFYNFQNPEGLRISPYFRSVCKAFGVVHQVVTSDDANEALIQLSIKGVVLLDLFPFAVPFNSYLRKKLIGRGIIQEFWEGKEYSIKTQIQDLYNTHHVNLHHEWDMCMIAPPLVSCHIVEAYSALHLNPLTNGQHNDIVFKETQMNSLRGCDKKKVATDSSGNPNNTLIRSAFNLNL